MPKRSFFFIGYFIVSLFSKVSAQILKNSLEQNIESIRFYENKGQITDQYKNARKDILFAGNVSGMTFYLKENGMSYQLNKVDSWIEQEVPSVSLNNVSRIEVPERLSTYRLDINWLNSQSNCTIQKEGTKEDVINYYLEHIPNGVTNVKAYSGITYENIYSQIDLHYYEVKGNLKYDFLVAPNADYHQIKLQVNGAEKIILLKDGGVLFKTPLGDIKEGAPIAYQNGKLLKSKWVIDKNVLSFNIQDYNPKLPLIIDPIARIWGTYYGDTGYNYANSCATDSIGNVYLTGYCTTSTGSLIATVGAHQFSFFGGSYDAYLVKFDNNGTRIWATYYGGAGSDYGRSCAIDKFGNVYMAGGTSSSLGGVIATSASHQNTYGGGTSDGFLVKFNSSGVRQWSTFYGDQGFDIIMSCALDDIGNVFCCGNTYAGSGTLISTPGCHQFYHGGGTTRDGFVVKFNSSGVRQWGTYYGGGYDENMSDVAVSPTGDIYLVGSTGSYLGTAIATPGSHQITYGGYGDAYLVKFNTYGVRQWGTYYGALEGPESGYSCCVDKLGCVYMVGGLDKYSVSIQNVISTPGSHQPVFGGGMYDGFLVKFNSNGARQWGTFYGGSSSEEVFSCAIDTLDNIYISGWTSIDSTASIATISSHQTSFGGATYDAFLVKFNSSGIRQWGTYYGGAGDEKGQGCATDKLGNVFMCGESSTSTGTSIATANSHQSTFVGQTSAYLVKFAECPFPTTPSNITPPINQSICSGQNTTLSVVGSGLINWFLSTTSNSVISNGATYTTPPLSLGTYTFYAESYACIASASRTAVQVTVNPLPVLTISGSTLTCFGSSINHLSGGALTYTWSNGTNGNVANLTPTTTTIYTVSGTNSYGCVNSISNTIIVNPLPMIMIFSTSEIICAGQTSTLNAIGANYYTWSNGLIGTQIVANPSVTSNYSVVGVDINGCSGFATITQSVETCTGINNAAETNSDYKIFPNPTKGIFIVQSNFYIENKTIELYNSLGELILIEKLQAFETTVNLTNKANGVYFVFLKESGRTIGQLKVIKE
ncbi:DUF7948 domain-containing protein [Aurantibacillus circumpalustris]|uniref:DUF7948 domain-containing protein n=1 Tax=Aurantibacillus circumpalustris TaxID=3036359 RepID=UPI00295B3213|nr:SBBP repeat-containing protein [Aurantibacillus circumpalustris]